MDKKKKILIGVLIACVVIAAGCIIAAIVIKSGHNNTPSATTGASTAAQAGETTAKQAATGDAKGIEYVKDAYKEDYKTVSSSGIKGEPDAKIKATFYNLAKDASPELVMENFDLIKVYEGFRIYDTTGTTDAQGKQSALLLIYAESGKATMVNCEEYKTTQERADRLTEYIEEFDKNYERHAAYAKSLEGERVLYE